MLYTDKGVTQPPCRQLATRSQAHRALFCNTATADWQQLAWSLSMTSSFRLFRNYIQFMIEHFSRI